ncbi:MAG TPA: PadR family transcriptional regulator [Candidatus Limnocylindrales bacterium]
MATETGLTTTAYAILGLLSVREWSTYELAAQMKRSLQFFWPRAASRIYEEPKRLVSLGYAQALRQPVGRRPRTVYQITPAGRDALRRWVDEGAADGRTYESEPLVRIFFGNVATKRAILGAVDQIGRTARIGLQSWTDVAGPYAEGRGRFPERLHVNALVMRLIVEISLVELSWAEWARAEVERWPNARRPADRKALEGLLAQLLSRVPPRTGDDRTHAT